MRGAFLFLGGACFGMGLLGGMVFWPSRTIDRETIRTNAIALQAFRALGCDPSLIEGALYSGCERVKHLDRLP